MKPTPKVVMTPAGLGLRIPIGNVLQWKKKKKKKGRCYITQKNKKLSIQISLSCPFQISESFVNLNNCKPFTNNEHKALWLVPTSKTQRSGEIDFQTSNH